MFGGSARNLSKSNKELSDIGIKVKHKMCHWYGVFRNVIEQILIFNESSKNQVNFCDHFSPLLGTDRLDCMRRISKGTAHFGVFSPEELLAAKWSGADVLVTSEMRFNDGKFVSIILHSQASNN